MTTCLETKGVYKSYIGEDGKQRAIIEDINIRVDQGELVCLLGVSGIGKTTLFHIVSGLELPDSGQVLLHGQDVTGVSGKLSYMQQKDLLLPFRTILDNVCIPLFLRGMKKQQAYAKAKPMLAEFGLSGTEKQYPSQLSGGMRQRAALLRAYLFSGDVMLLDEPFSALDAITKSSLYQWFKKVIAARQTTALFITHDIDEAVLLSDRIYILSGNPGRVTEEIQIDFDGQRDSALTMTDEFLVVKKQVLASL